MHSIKHLSLLGLVTALITLAGCETTNNAFARKTQSVEYYRIFDIQTNANRQAVAKAASNGLGRNVNNASEALPIPTSAELPEKPGRFKLINPLAGSPLAAMAARGGGAIDFKMATCEGASWSARARRSVAGSNDLNITLCLFQYKGGYHLDMYGMFTKEEGGLMQLSRNMAATMVGTPEEWTEKTFLDVVRSIKSVTGAEITLLEAQPEIAGTPWLDSGETSK
jgi:hypothetical protein